jgi:putative membrane protein
MSVGILFRREVNLTYARIQDIHLRSGLIQRWLGLGNLEVQTASGSSGAEMVIEGFKDFEAIRDFLYTKMRGYQAEQKGATTGPTASVAAREADSEIVTLLLSIRDELRRTRELVETRAGEPPSSAPLKADLPPHV